MAEQNIAWKATHHTYGDELWFGGYDGPGMWEIEGAEAYLPGDHDTQARLIAAAPDLLAALQSVIDDLVGGIQDCIDNGGSETWIKEAHGRLATARNAIAKATGQDAP